MAPIGPCFECIRGGYKDSCETVFTAARCENCELMGFPCSFPSRKASQISSHRVNSAGSNVFSEAPSPGRFSSPLSFSSTPPAPPDDDSRKTMNPENTSSGYFPSHGPGQAQQVNFGATNFPQRMSMSGPPSQGSLQHQPSVAQHPQSVLQHHQPVFQLHPATFQNHIPATMNPFQMGNSFNPPMPTRFEGSPNSGHPISVPHTSLNPQGLSTGHPFSPESLSHLSAKILRRSQHRPSLPETSKRIRRASKTMHSQVYRDYGSQSNQLAGAAVAFIPGTSYGEGWNDELEDFLMAGIDNRAGQTVSNQMVFNPMANAYNPLANSFSPVVNGRELQYSGLNGGNRTVSSQAANVLDPIGTGKELPDSGSYEEDSSKKSHQTVSNQTAKGVDRIANDGDLPSSRVTGEVRFIDGEEALAVQEFERLVDRMR